MAKFEFKLPDIGEGVTEGEIVTWLVNVGDDVREDQDMVEVMTDKATVTIGAPKRGVVAELRGAVGDVVPVGQTLVVLDLGGAPDAVAAHAAAPVPAAPAPRAPEPQAAAPAQAPPPSGASDAEPSEKDVAASAVGDIRESLPGMGAMRAPRAPSIEGAAVRGSGVSVGEYFNEKPHAAPATRKLARELGIDLRHVQPSGASNRVTREDVEQHAARGSVSHVVAPSSVAITEHDAVTLRPAPARPASAAVPAASAPVRPAVRRDDQRVPIRGLRKRIYENMARSKHTAAHFTYVDECDATALVALRDQTRSVAEAQGVKLSYLPFIIKAVVGALKKHPALNCVVDDAAGEMVLRGSYDIGVAAATEAGLIVPVLRNADSLTVLDVARELERLATAARTGKSRKEDLGGSGFTITSLGKLGGLFATPIVNYPEVAILGVHEMKRKPVVRGERIEIGQVMLLSLSFDHRIIDGHVGAAFAREIIDYLETPGRLLLDLT